MFALWMGTHNAVIIGGPYCASTQEKATTVQSTSMEIDGLQLNKINSRSLHKFLQEYTLHPEE